MRRIGKTLDTSEKVYASLWVFSLNLLHVGKSLQRKRMVTLLLGTSLAQGKISTPAVVGASPGRRIVDLGTRINGLEGSREVLGDNEDVVSALLKSKGYCEANYASAGVKLIQTI
jgi:hypothetical protein